MDHDDGGTHRQCCVDHAGIWGRPARLRQRRMHLCRSRSRTPRRATPASVSRIERRTSCLSSRFQSSHRPSIGNDRHQVVDDSTTYGDRGRMATTDLFGNDPAPQASRLAPKLRTLADRGVYFGTSSWKYDGWLGSIYSRDRYVTRGKFSKAKFEENCLAEYAQTFPDGLRRPDVLPVPERAVLGKAVRIDARKASSSASRSPRISRSRPGLPTPATANGPACGTRTS